MARPPAFKIETGEAGARVTVAVHGELDLATAPRLDAELERVAALDGLELVIVDLRELAFMDSAGLETLLRLDARTRAADVELAIVRGPRAVERLFAVTQLDRRLRIVDDPAQI